MCSSDLDLDNLSEMQGIRKMGRTNLIQTRIRKGKIQRGIRRSNVPGYEMKNGRLVRMSYTELRNRKMGARLAKFKKRARQSQSNIKRKRASQRRHGLGLA